MPTNKEIIDLACSHGHPDDNTYLVFQCENELLDFARKLIAQASLRGMTEADFSEADGIAQPVAEVSERDAFEAHIRDTWFTGSRTRDYDIMKALSCYDDEYTDSDVRASWYAFKAGIALAQRAVAEVGERELLPGLSWAGVDQLAEQCTSDADGLNARMFAKRIAVIAQPPVKIEARRYCKGDEAWTEWALISLAEYEQWKGDETFEFRPLLSPAVQNRAFKFSHYAALSQAIKEQSAETADFKRSFAQSPVRQESESDGFYCVLGVSECFCKRESGCPSEGCKYYSQPQQGATK